MAALPALPAVAQTGYSSGSGSSNQEFPKLAEVTPESVAAGTARFFQKDQLAALSRLAELVVPKTGDRPGAVESGVPAFLDFLLSASPADRQGLYREGLDRLNSDASRLYGKTFAALSPTEAKAVLKPLGEAWTYNPPADGLARFLREVKDDLLQATVNSREFAVAQARRNRSASGLAPYWLPLD